MLPVFSVVRLDGSRPIRYGLKQDLEGKYCVLKNFLTQKTNVPYFMLVDVYGGTVRVSAVRVGLIVIFDIVMVS